MTSIAKGNCPSRVVPALGFVGTSHMSSEVQSALLPAPEENGFGEKKKKLLSDHRKVESGLCFPARKRFSV